MDILIFFWYFFNINWYFFKNHDISGDYFVTSHTYVPVGIGTGLTL